MIRGLCHCSSSTHIDSSELEQGQEQYQWVHVVQHALILLFYGSWLQLIGEQVCQRAVVTVSNHGCHAQASAHQHRREHLHTVCHRGTLGAEPTEEGVPFSGNMSLDLRA